MESPSSKCQPLFSFCLLLVILQCPQIDIVVVLIFYLEFIIVISEKVLLARSEAELSNIPLYR